MRERSGPGRGRRRQADDVHPHQPDDRLVPAPQDVLRQHLTLRHPRTRSREHARGREARDFPRECSCVRRRSPPSPQNRQPTGKLHSWPVRQASRSAARPEQHAVPAVRACRRRRGEHPAGVGDRGVDVEVGRSYRPGLEDLAAARALHRQAVGRRHAADGTSAKQCAELPADGRPQPLVILLPALSTLRRRPSSAATTSRMSSSGVSVVELASTRSPSACSSAPSRGAPRVPPESRAARSAGGTARPRPRARP